MEMKPENPLSPDDAKTILDCIADGVFTVNKDMRIAYFNKTAEKMTGIPQHQAIGQYCFEVLRANICQKTCALKCTFETGKSISNVGVNILRADGTEIPVSISTAVLKDRDGNIVGGVESFRDLSALEELKKEIKRTYTFEDIVSKNHRILQIFDILPNIAENETTVLLQGPSGTGKELFARAIHNLSLRKKRPFIAVNCGALPDTLLESELFGYVKGAFTDAKKDKPGRFALAKGGTILLDEVDSLSPSTQVKLLRVIQEKEFEPLGATTPVKANVRIIAATKENLAQLVRKGDFRDDLFFRLNVVRIDLPPLVERRDDIPLLVNHFIDKFNRKMDRQIERVSDDVLALLMRYLFPGNVRELENIIEHAFVMCREIEIQLEHLPAELLHDPVLTELSAPHIAIQASNFERRKILTALEKHGWQRAETASALRMHRATLWRKMKKYGLLK